LVLLLLCSDTNIGNIGANILANPSTAVFLKLACQYNEVTFLCSANPCCCKDDGTNGILVAMFEFDQL